MGCAPSFPPSGRIRSRAGPLFRCGVARTLPFIRFNITFILRFCQLKRTKPRFLLPVCFSVFIRKFSETNPHDRAQF
jgi:hypothetical protein